MEDLHTEATNTRNADVRKKLVIEGMKKTMDAFVFEVTTANYQQYVRDAVQNGRTSTAILTFPSNQYGPEFFEEDQDTGTTVKIHPFYVGYLLRGPAKGDLIGDEFFKYHQVEKIQDRLEKFFAPFSVKIAVRKSSTRVVLQWES